MKDKDWKQRISTAVVWIAVAIVVANILWYGWQALEWNRKIYVRLGAVEIRLDNVEIRMSNLEQAVVSKHPELGQAPPNQE